MNPKNYSTNNKVIFLFDIDCFFANCHIAQDKNLVNKPVVVSSSNKNSIIVTSNYQARNLQIFSGMPLFKALKLCKDLIVIDTDFSLYTKYSELIFELISKEFTNKIEVVSIDECYIDATDIWKKYGSVKNMAEKIIQRVFEVTNITSSIGISINKFLAKMCVSFNKPYGVTILLPENIKEQLWPLKVREMFGVGEATTKLLNENNITTIGDIANSSEDKLISLLGKNGFKLWNNANGIGDDEIININEFRSMSSELTLDNPTNDINLLEEILFEIASNLSIKLIKQNLSCRTLTIILNYKKNYKIISFQKSIHKKKNTISKTIKENINSLESIYSLSKQLLSTLYKNDMVNLIGIRLSNFAEEIYQFKQLKIEDRNIYSKNNIDNFLYNLNFKFNKKVFITADQLLRDNSYKKTQNKYLYETHQRVTNKSIKTKWKEEGDKNDE